MHENSLKQQMMSGMFWRFAERIIAQGVSFVVSLVLARLLMPEDYGVVSIINIFITIANVFLTSGLSTALIQKKDASELEFNSIFYCNLVLGIAAYAGMYIAAPWLAQIYKMPILTRAVRVFAIRLPISAFQSIQQAYVSKEMQFKKFFFATITGTLVSAAIGIGMAYTGFGVWALIAQYLSNTIIDTFFLFSIVEWKPKPQFSSKAVRPLISYGWKVMVTDLIGTLFNNLGGFIVGIQYTSADLAYYTKGKQLPTLFRNNIYTTVLSVLFPGMSKVSDNLSEVKRVSRKSMRLLTYTIIPIMIGMILASKNLTILLYTDKWIAMVPFIRVMCLEAILSVPGTITLQAIKASGRSDLMLKMEFIKKPVLLASIIISMRFGVMAIAWTLPFNTLVDLIINGTVANRLIGYSLAEQAEDCLIALIISLMMGVSVYAISLLKMTGIKLLIMQVLVGLSVYFVLSCALKNEAFLILKDYLKKSVTARKM
jgi:O-antigen/teichoic acid export membrane protein